MDKVVCPRLYADAQGESHFDEVEIPLQSTATPWGAPLDISSPVPAACWLFAGASPGSFFDWHTVAFPQLGIVVGGEIEIRTSDGQARLLKRGDYLLAEDTTGKGHQGRVVGAEPVLYIFVNPSM